jgi:hypothetical protein
MILKRKRISISKMMMSFMREKRQMSEGYLWSKRK